MLSIVNRNVLQRCGKDLAALRDKSRCSQTGAREREQFTGSDAGCHRLQVAALLTPMGFR